MIQQLGKWSRLLLKVRSAQVVNEEARLARWQAEKEAEEAQRKERLAKDPLNILLRKCWKRLELLAIDRVAALADQRAAQQAREIQEFLDFKAELFLEGYTISDSGDIYRLGQEPGGWSGKA